ncbi:Krueppel-like factor 15 [Lecanosticta acicola]|uniref:Krueppel-like factor 15 n=1 Tax=Lecanosticta acicola TaxID=111012 RepID=A0AAI9EAH8_9PEZI|nr:Krueppel-like factor 15 [Lecanosticta acicola]
MAVNHPHTLEYKTRLLKHLLSTKEWLLDPHIGRFWEFISDTFKHPKAPESAPKLSGKELEEFCDAEAAIWIDENNNPKEDRRKGYEAGSEYDELMGKWMTVWKDMAVPHWVVEMDRIGDTHHKFSIVPSAYRDKVRDKVAEIDRVRRENRAKAAQHVRERQAAEKAASTKKKALKRSASRHDGKLDSISRTEDPKFEYDGEKLKKVVQAARERAIQVGKHDLAAAVQQIYEDALRDMKLRILLEAILTQSATTPQNEQFQEYVRTAKRKLKAIKGSGAKAKASPSVQHLPATTSALHSRQLGSRERDVDSAYVSGRGSDKSTGEDANNESMTAGSHEPQKRRRESITSSEAAEADLEEAERAAKRRRGENVDDDSGSYDPSQKRKATKTHKKRPIHQPDNVSRESSPLSEAGDTDIEAAKEAYVDEMVRRKSAEASRRAIEDEYGPVSPTVADDASWKSMPSPTLHSTQMDRSNSMQEQEQTQAGAQDDARHEVLGASSVPAPPADEPPAQASAEQLTPAESSHAFQIISGAAAEAVQPAISRLEGKIDSLLSGRGDRIPLPQGRPVPACSSRGPDIANATRELVNIQEMLQSNELDPQSPETTTLISQLARNAAEASIYAAEAARRAGEMARDVSLVLLQLGENRKKKQSGEAGASSAPRPEE